MQGPRCSRGTHGIIGIMRSQLLDVLDDDQRRAVLAKARRRHFKRNEVVFHDGDPGDTLHMIVKGHFAIRITTPLGDEAMVRVLGAPEYFGELALLAPGPPWNGYLARWE